jgi:hypothetical protein
MHALPLPFSCVVLALAALPAAAQQPGQGLHMYTASLPHPPGVTGTAQEVVLGQLSDDGVPDAAVLHGTEVRFLYAVDRRNSWVALSGSYGCLARVPGVGSSAHELLALGTAGLVRLAWDSTPTVRTLVPSAVAGTSAWSGAKELQTRVDENGTVRVAALSGDGLSLLYGTWSPATGTLTSAGSYTLSAANTALLLLDLDDDGDTEYAVAGTGGLRLLNSAGTQYHEVPELGTGAQLLCVPVSDGADRVGWIRTPAGLSSFLTVVYGDTTAEQPVWFAGATVRHATLADVAGESDPELLVVADGFPFAVGLVRDDGNPTFQDLATGYYLINLDRAKTPVPNHPNAAAVTGSGSGAYGPGQLAPALAAADLDGDGDDDLFAAGHPSGSARAIVHFGVLVNEEQLSPGHWRPWLPLYRFTHDGTLDEGRFEFILPTDEGQAAGATHVQVAIWTEDSSSGFIDPQAVAPVGRWDLSATQPEAPGYTIPTLLVPDLSALGAQGRLHLEMSFLELDTFGRMLHAFPAYHEVLELEDLPPSTVPYEFALIFETDEDGDGGGGSTQRPPISPPPAGVGMATTP